MSKKTIKNIIELCESIDRNTPIVQERMRNAGLNPDPALVNSLAKYWPVLERLAAE